MAKNKMDFKALLLKKGEKILLVVSVALCALMLVWGVMELNAAPNPAKWKTDLDSATSNVVRRIEKSDTTVDKLPSYAEDIEVMKFTLVQAKSFRSGQPFEPVQLPSARRDNPIVLAPQDSQVFYYAGSYKGYDRLFEERDGQLIVRVGVIKTDIKSGAYQWGDIGTKFAPAGKGPRRPMPQLDPQANPQTPVAPPGPGGDMGGNGQGAREELVVEYKLWEDAKKSGLPPAKTIYPIRMAIVMASFPLKEQLEEIKRALRLRTLAEARYESSAAVIESRIRNGQAPVPPGGGVAPVPPPGAVVPPRGGEGVPMPVAPGGGQAVDQETMPAFIGLVVERKVTTPDGQTTNWEAYNHQDRFFEKFSLYETPYVVEEGYLPYFLRPDLGLSCPLPMLADGQLLNYPPNVSMPSIFNNYQKLLAEKAKLIPASEVDDRFKRGKNNPYLPSASTPGAFGMESGSTNITGGGGPVDPMAVVPGGVVDPNKLAVDHLLLRFIDPDLRPNHTYEYRVKVQMQNPNYKNKDQVANESIANVPMIESTWFDIGKKVTVPHEDFLFASSTKKYEEKVKRFYEECGKPDLLNRVMELKEVQDNKKVIVQFQRWQDYYGKEPIGNWIQAEMPVGPGEYIGRRTLIELPVWRSAIKGTTSGGPAVVSPVPMPVAGSNDPFTGGFILPSLDVKSVIDKWPADTATKKYTMPRARIMNFQTRHILIDFDGGKVTTKTGGTTTVDDAAADLLIFRDDGKIEVRSEAIDMANTVPKSPRALRDETWAKWVKRVRDASPAETTPSGTGTGFGPVRGSGG